MRLMGIVLVLAASTLACDGTPASAEAEGRDAAPAKGAAVALKIDTGDATQREKWPDARTQLEACDAVNLEIFYSFGSAQLSAERQSDGCRIRVATAGELSEKGGPQHRYLCSTGVLSLPWIYSDGKQAVRDNPPDAELSKSSDCKAE